MFEPETAKVTNPDPKGIQELPVDFMVMLPGKSQWKRYQRYADGLWNEFVWCGEWQWSDDVGESTALDSWLTCEQAAAMMIVDEYEEDCRSVGPF